MRIKTILAVIFIMAALAWAGRGDFMDEQEQFALYCANTYGPNAIYPDYDNVGQDACGKVLR
jgi:hypothetical protein